MEVRAFGYDFSAAHAAMQCYADRNLLAGLSSAVPARRDLAEKRFAKGVDAGLLGSMACAESRPRDVLGSKASERLSDVNRRNLPRASFIRPIKGQADAARILGALLWGPPRRERRRAPLFRYGLTAPVTSEGSALPLPRQQVAKADSASPLRSPKSSSASRSRQCPTFCPPRN
jgi:hypothetical protein